MANKNLEGRDLIKGYSCIDTKTEEFVSTVKTSQMKARIMHRIELSDHSLMDERNQKGLWAAVDRQR